VHGDATGEVVAHQVEALLARSHDKRLYIEINLAETHRPYPQPPSDPVVEVPRFLDDTPEARSELAALQAAIETMDVAAGRVLAALEVAGRAENAIVVFTTDHGVAMPRAKCTLYDPGIEVALIMRWPGRDLRGVREDLVSNIDVLPTLLEAAGIEIPGEVQGRSLLDDDRPREAIFAEKTFHSYYDPMRAIRTQRHKLIRNFETAFRVEVPGDIQTGAIFRADPGRYSTDRPAVVELYDLEADPLEQHNLAGRDDIDEVERELNERLWAWMEETDDPLLKGPVASPRYRLAMER
jgi:arylsulfatase A-like enzyme